MNPFVISLAVRLTILLLAGGLMAVAVQRSTSAMRHLVIATTLACVIALPITMVMVPEWRVGVLTARVSVDASAPATATNTVARKTLSAGTNVDAPTRMKMSTSSRSPSSTSAATESAESKTHATIHPVLVSSNLSATTSPSSLASTADVAANVVSEARPPLALTPQRIALGVWLLGVIFGLAWIAIGRLGLARVRRRATPLATYEWRTILEAEAMHAGVAKRVALLTSPAVSMPVTWGVLSPVIVLPETAHAWPHDRKRVVIMHEMAHIARRDSATQFVATLACVAYWLHPLVILAARRLRAECERACDERVLERGTPAAEYAAHLLDVARLSRSFGAASIVSVAMARPSQLEGRLLAVLRAEPRQSRMSGRARVATALSAVAMLVAISAFKPVVREVHVHAAAKVAKKTVVNAKTTKSIDTSFVVPARGPVAPVAPTLPSIPSTPSVPSTPAALTAPSPAEAWDMPAPVAPAAPLAPTATYSAIAPMAPMITMVVPSAPAALAAPVAPVFAPPRSFHSFRDSTFQKSVPAQSGGTLDLDLDTGGDIVITGTDDSKVTVEGTLGGPELSEQTVTLEGSGGDARMETRFARASGRESSEDSFNIRVPKKYNVHVSSAGGTIRIENLDGTFRGSTGGGNISITNAHGTANLSTGGGKIQIANSHLDGSVMTGFGPIMFHDVTGSIVDNYAARHASGTAKIEIPESEYLPRMSFDFDDDSGSQTHTKIYRNRAKVMSDTAWKRSLAGVEKMRVMINDTAMVKMRKSLDRMKVSMMKDTIYVKTFKGFDRYAYMYGDSSRKYQKRQKVYMKSADSTILLDLEPYRDQLELSKKQMEAARANAYVAIGDDDLKALRSLEIDTDDDYSKGSSNHVIVIDKSGGSVQLREAPHGAHIVTGGGSITIGPSNAAVSAVTGGGDIEIGPAGGSTEAATGAGDVQITMADGDPHPVNIASGKGDVEVRLPKDANVTLDLESAYTESSGKHTKIVGDWPLTVTESPDWDSSRGTPRKYVRVRQKIGHGGPVIRVRTVNGDIRLKRTN